MITTAPITTIIQRRYSCRDYDSTPLEEENRQALLRYIEELPPGPFNKSSRFALVAASDGDRSALRGLGTYGTIKNPPAFIIGASAEGPLTLEDFGYRMEQIILFATGLGLGTCWLGGFFTRSSFAHRIAARKNEILPAVCSLGYAASDGLRPSGPAQQPASRHDRLPWEALFFDGRFGNPLRPEISGAYQVPLELVRLAPSASNKQPWRILRQGGGWHFYLQRTRGYRELAMSRFTGIADMQRIDMGIAMSHFELAALEAGLSGKWVIEEPGIQMLDSLTSYVVTWNPD